ncbi:MAG: amino acid ABC transporter substrate-binding protein [Lachnospiraceae bacterium]|nr:amino acid ABC transporter substrate-binding protein [Lachnospiraceae bacterium]
MKKKAAAGILAITLVLAGLTGCGNNETAVDSQQAAESVSAAETGQTEGTEQVQESEKTQGTEQTEDGEEDLLDKVKAAGVLKIGTEGTYAPYTFHDDSNELTGFDVEVAEKIAEKLGVEAEFVETKWDSIIAGLDAGRFDIIVNQVSISEERLEKYDFSVPYTYTHGALIVKGNDEEITGFDKIAGKKAAQSLTSNWAELAEENGAEIVSTDGFNQSVELVLAGRADLTLNDDLTYYDYVNQKPDADLKIAALSEETSDSAVMIRKGNPKFVEAVNKALEELSAEGVLSEISERYFGADVTKK